MSSYGATIYGTNGIERMRFSDPILAVYAFVVSGNGSVTVPGVYDHALVTVSPAGAIMAPGFHCNSVSVASNDVVTWYSDGRTVTTIVFLNFCK